MVLLPGSADKRVIVPAGAWQVDANWLSDTNFNDAGWLLCTGSPGGVGYERHSDYDSMISLDVEAQMYSHNTSCYIRIPFGLDVNTPGKLTDLHLKISYDDGFVAYLNGREVARLVGEQSEDTLKQALSALRGEPCPGLGLLEPGGQSSPLSFPEQERDSAACSRNPARPDAGSPAENEGER